MADEQPQAYIYLDKVDLGRYWPADATVTCEDFVTQVKAGETDIGDYPFLSPRQAQALRLVLEAEKYLPSVPLMTVPQPIESELIALNGPDENAPVLVTGNNRFTFEVLAAIWAQGITPAYILLVDCQGNTLDMAVVYDTFTPYKLFLAVKASGLEDKVGHRHMIVPGLTSALVPDFINATGWEVEVGPVCAVELPLFLGDRWVFPEPV